MAHEEKCSPLTSDVADNSVPRTTKHEERKDSASSVVANPCTIKTTVSFEVNNQEATIPAPVPEFIFTRPAGVRGAIQESNSQNYSLERIGVGEVRTALSTGVDRADAAPLTEKNLRLLDSRNALSNTYDPRISLFPPLCSPVEKGNMVKQDEDIQTVSDESDSGGMQDSTSELFAKSRMYKYIDLIDGPSKSPRKAYVEAYFKPQNKHLIAFCDSVGEGLQIRLTEDNHRILDRCEIRAMSSCANVRESPRSSGAESPQPDISAGISMERARSKSETLVNDDERKFTSKRSRRIADVHLRAGKELIGACITIRRSTRNRSCEAMVLGFRGHHPDIGLHKVFYFTSQTTAVLNLSKTKWLFKGSGSVSSTRNSLLRKRLVVYKDHKTLQKVLTDRRAHHMNILPFEAFVLRFLGSFNYLVLYTQDDSIEELRLAKDDKWWSVLESEVLEVDQIPLISWSNPSTCILEKTTK